MHYSQISIQFIHRISEYYFILFTAATIILKLNGPSPLLVMKLEIPVDMPLMLNLLFTAHLFVSFQRFLVTQAHPFKCCKMSTYCSLTTQQTGALLTFSAKLCLNDKITKYDYQTFRCEIPHLAPNVTI